MIGTVTRIDRANNQVWTRRNSGLEYPVKYSGVPPAPLSDIELVEADNPGSGNWRMAGRYGDGRTVLHDDFLTGAGDSTWTFLNNGGAGVAVFQFFGACVINSGINAGNHGAQCKDQGSTTIPALPTALWMSSYIGTINGSGANANSDFLIGWADQSLWQFAGAAGLTLGARAGVLELRIFNNAGGETDVLLSKTIDSVGITQGPNTWVDLVMCSSFFACWINGDGPYVGTSGFPTNTLTPGFGCYANSNNNVQFAADFLRIEQFACTQQPSSLPKFATLPGSSA